MLETQYHTHKNNQYTKHLNNIFSYEKIDINYYKGIVMTHTQFFFTDGETLSIKNDFCLWLKDKMKSYIDDDDEAIEIYEYAYLLGEIGHIAKQKNIDGIFGKEIIKDTVGYKFNLSTIDRFELAFENLLKENLIKKLDKNRYVLNIIGY